MIIHATRTRRVPAWYTRHVMRLVQRLCAGNPGFHRLVVRIEGDGVAYLKQSDLLVNPDIEPRVRTLLSRVLVLAPPVTDDDPWQLL